MATLSTVRLLLPIPTFVLGMKHGFTPSIRPPSTARRDATPAAIHALPDISAWD